MSRIDLEQLRKDVEAGTPGPWKLTGYGAVSAYGSVDTISGAVLCSVAYADETIRDDDEGRCWTLDGKQEANARRIARLPDLERAYLDLRKAADELAAALSEAADEIDGYIRQEYPGDHPVHARYRERDFAANPARAALIAIEEDRA